LQFGPRHERLPGTEVRFEIRVIRVDPGIDDRDIRSTAGFVVRVSDLGVNPVDPPREGLDSIAATPATIARRTTVVTGIVVDSAHRSIAFDVPDVLTSPEGLDSLIGEPTGNGPADRAEIEGSYDRFRSPTCLAGGVGATRADDTFRGTAGRLTGHQRADGTARDAAQ
jgi:hypothetical protein